MQKTLRSICLPSLALAVAGCGGGSSDSGAAAGSATPYSGAWNLVATLNVNIAGNATFLTDTSRVVIGASGNSVITDTDSECSLDVVVNGDIMTYETSCVFTATSDDATAPCVLKLKTRARIRGTPGSAQLSSSFGPDTVVCSGAAASYTGTLVGSQGEPPDDGTNVDDGGETDTGDGEEA
ncbi:MAG TPA: hypothetical protein VK973_08980 [Arenicellales bacterium]|nr:hypothetical protein [Arenicellales bacterium]